VAILVLGVRSQPYWVSPGKTLAMLFATMCILDGCLDLLASTIVAGRFAAQSVPSEANPDGYPFGIWYRGFAASIGYVLALPLLLLVLIKSRQQHATWRLAWCGFLIFTIAIIAHLHFRLSLPEHWQDWYFEVAIGIPIVLLAIAFLRGLYRNELDWWTSLTCVPVILTWCIAVGMKSIASRPASAMLGCGLTPGR